tara:strand:- start:1115 stop:1822 length:708 start_codon:yes stop_codon:yes gene_type:complete
MDAKGILITVVVIVVIFLIYKAFFGDNALSSLEDAKKMQQIASSSLGSSDSNSSANFTYSVWFYVDDWNYRYGEPKIVLAHGGASASKGGFGIVLGGMQNDLNIAVETYPSESSTEGTVHTCNVQNIPLQKWVHCLVSVYGKSLDVYIDGKLVRTCVLPGIAKVDVSKDVFITPLGGFSGYTSNFQFFPNATNPQEAYNIYKKGFGGSALGNLFNKYRIKIVFLEDNQEQGSFEI